MSRYTKNKSSGRYHAIEKRYSIDTHTSIFKVTVEYQQMTGYFLLLSHLSKMTLVEFKVAKKVIMFVSGENDILDKPNCHGYSGEGTMKLSMMDHFLLDLCYKDPSRTM